MNKYKKIGLVLVAGVVLFGSSPVYCNAEEVHNSESTITVQGTLVADESRESSGGSGNYLNENAETIPSKLNGTLDNPAKPNVKTGDVLTLGMYLCLLMISFLLMLLLKKEKKQYLTE